MQRGKGQLPYKAGDSAEFLQREQLNGIHSHCREGTELSTCVEADWKEAKLQQ